MMKDRRLFILFLVVLVDMLSFSIVLPMLPYLAKTLGASPFKIGILGATYSVMQLFAAPVLGRLSDRLGRKPVLMVSIAGTVGGFIVLATARSFPVLLASRALDGVTGGNISVAQAYIADITEPADRGRAMGMIGAAFGMGFILGPITGGILSGISYAAPAWLGAFLAAANLILIATMVPESLTAQDKAHFAEKPRRGFNSEAFVTAIRHPRVGPLLVIRTLTGLAHSTFESGFALWGIAALALSARTNSFVLAYVGVLSVFVQAFLIGRLTKKFSDDRLLTVATLLTAVGLFAWGFSPSVAVLVGIMPILSLGMGVSNTVMTSALTKSVTHDEVGGILGLNTSIQSATRVVGPLVAGAMIDYVATWAPGVTTAIVTVIAALIAWTTLCVRPGRASCDSAPS